MTVRLLALVGLVTLTVLAASTTYQQLRVPGADLTPREPAPALHLAPTQIHFLLEPPVYRYYGTREQRGPLTLSLDSSSVTGDAHVAVWFGANYGLSRWVQAGVADVGGGPNLYIETNNSHGAPSLTMWSTTLGESARVRVGSRGGCWRVRIDSYTSPWVWFRYRPTILSTLETYGDATGSGRIGRRVVHS